MVEVQCEHCGRVLIGARQIVGLTNTPDGIELAFVCGCGRPGGVLTGRARSAQGATPRPLRPPARPGMNVDTQESRERKTQESGERR